MRPKRLFVPICALVGGTIVIYFPTAHARYTNKRIILSKPQSLNDISKLHIATSGPLCLIILDTRSNLAVDNSARLLGYFVNCPVRVEPIISYANPKPHEFLNARQLEIGSLDSYRYLKDALYFYDTRGRLRYSNSLTRDIKEIFTDLDEILLGQNSATVQPELTIGNNIQGSTLGNVVGSSYKLGRFWLYLIFTEICLGCKSGNALIEIDDYCEKNSGIGATLIAINEYSTRDLADFKREHEISTEIRRPSPEFIESWRNTERQIERLHPWDGTILVVNHWGVILYKSKNAKDCIEWVGSQNRGGENEKENCPDSVGGDTVPW